MATSGSVDFSVSRDTIITRAWQLLGVVEEGGTATANQITDGTSWLNLMVKNWQIDGLHLWSLEHIVLFPVKAQRKYSFGTSPSRMCKDQELIQTELNGSHASGATTLTVDSTTGMAISDKIGIQTTSSGITWTTISTIPSATSLTIAAGLDGIAADNNNVYTYTTAFIYRPTKIQEAWLEQDDSSDLPLSIYSRTDYNKLSNKESSGKVIQLYYDPQLDTGELFTWQVPGDNELSELIHLIVQRPLEDFDATGDTPDFPQEWYLPIVYNLAMYALPVYGTASTDATFITNMARILKMDVTAWDSESTSLFLSPRKR